MAFPRIVGPMQVSRPWLPGALRDVGHSGGIQIRATKQVGWTWEEKWPPLRVGDADDMALLAVIDYMWNRGVIDTLTHPLIPGSGRPPNGAGGGTPLVDGASQTGGALVTDGWPNNITNVVRAGDVIKLAGDNVVYQNRTDASSNGTGQATLNLVPNLRVSPANDAVITRTGVTYRVIIMGRSRFEPSRAPDYFAGMTVIFTEMFL